ncbi:MAG: DUF4249 domain-containing protein [Bacteroidota bacterium]|nr:DUF4249 domain-containing protein [Bacteroidota bacterium]
MKKFLFTTTLLVSLAMVFQSCQNVISVDLNKANPQVVIEGKVTDQPGPYTVTISKTGNYFDPVLEFPPVAGATAVISDDKGNTDTLHETAAGTYSTSTLQGMSGRTYSLTVTSEGKTYSGVSFLPPKVSIDSLSATSFRAPGGDKVYEIDITFTDPPEAKNYYRIALHIGSLSPDSIAGGRYYLYTDKLFNGNTVTQEIRFRDDIGSIRPGDTLTVDLLSIDEATYNYFNTLKGIIGENDRNISASPANPNTNLSNGSLGYFAAYAIDTKNLILK